jgi:hypothetical protein
MVKRLVRATALALVGVALMASAAFANPDFGPGSSSKGPQDGKCHPPGQVLPTPECKE